MLGANAQAMLATTNSPGSPHRILRRSIPPDRITTSGALYHHFGDKKGLLIAVVQQIDAEMDDRLQAISDFAEAALWIAGSEEGSTRLAQGTAGLELLLRGLLITA